MSTPDHESGSQADDYRQGARNRKIFTTADYILGLPSSVMMGCGAAVLATFILFTWWAAGVMAVLIVPAMYHIHKDDPRALKLWRAVMLEPYTKWQAGTARSRRLIILKE